jgi:hypothetical protein
MTRHTLRFTPSGQVTGFYTEAIDLHALGRLSVVRATDIRFNDTTQQWEVRRVGAGDEGAPLFSHPSRQECVRWEMENLVPPAMEIL